MGGARGEVRRDTVFDTAPRMHPLGASPPRRANPALDGRGLGRVGLSLGLLATPTSIPPWKGEEEPPRKARS